MIKEGKIQGKLSDTSARALLLKATIANSLVVQRIKAEVKDLLPRAPVTGYTTQERRGQEKILVDEVVEVNGEPQTCQFINTGPTPSPKALYEPREYRPIPHTRFMLGKPVCVLDKLHEDFDVSSVLSTSIRYGTLCHRPAKDKFAVGGLSRSSVQILVSQQFVRRCPPQYKGFACTHDDVLTPPPATEASPTRPTLHVPHGELPYVHRKLNTPLDTLMPLTATVKAPTLDIDDRIDTRTFVPSESVATLNSPRINFPLRTTRIDLLTYPFCKEKSRVNKASDLFDYLLSDGTASGHKLQVFTSVTSQQPGKGDILRSLGRVVTKVIRTWPFLQSETEAVYEEERLPLSRGEMLLLSDRPRHSSSLPRGNLITTTSREVRNTILMRMPSSGAEECNFGDHSSSGDDIVFDNDAPAHANLLRYAEPAPEGLLEIIAATRVGKKQVEFGHVLNLPKIRAPELVKPVGKESGYNPWSHGRPKTSSKFVRSVAEMKEWPRVVSRSQVH